MRPPDINVSSLVVSAPTISDPPHVINSANIAADRARTTVHLCGCFSSMKNDFISSTIKVAHSVKPTDTMCEPSTAKKTGSAKISRSATHLCLSLPKSFVAAYYETKSAAYIIAGVKYVTLPPK